MQNDLILNKIELFECRVMGDMMSLIKEASVAGLFYPSDPIELSASIENFYSRSRSIKTKRPLAIIAPHAGHLYSGELATQALSLLKDYTEEVCKIAVIATSSHGSGDHIS